MAIITSEVDAFHGRNAAQLGAAGWILEWYWTITISGAAVVVLVAAASFMNVRRRLDALRDDRKDSEAVAIFVHAPVPPPPLRRQRRGRGLNVAAAIAALLLARRYLR